jgi:hypothetical protein
MKPIDLIFNLTFMLSAIALLCYSATIADRYHLIALTFAAVGSVVLTLTADALLNLTLGGKND